MVTGEAGRLVEHGTDGKFYLEVQYSEDVVIGMRLHTESNLSQKGAASTSRVFLVDLVTRQLVPVQVEDYSKVNYRIVPVGQSAVGVAVESAAAGEEVSFTPVRCGCRPAGC
jgi:hypothetical protein